MIYLQNEVGDQVESLIEYNKPEYRLQCNDILAVNIRTSNEQVNSLMGEQKMGNQSIQAGVQSGGDLYYMTGYSIDENGFVKLPFLGHIYIQGLTLNEAFHAIDSVVSISLKNYYLDVKLGGIRFSGLGEFKAPGKKVILQNQATIFEAIAACGDLSTVANREDIKLIRQYPDGTRIHSINLLNDDIIKSEFYFVQPNDVIYAEPLPQKSWGVGVTGSSTLNTIINTLSTSIALTLSVLTLYGQ